MSELIKESIRRSKSLVCLGLLLTIVGGMPALPHRLSAVKASTPDKSGTTLLGRRIDDYLTRLSGFGYSGAMLVAKDGRIVLRKGYGLANDQARHPITPSTVFDIGSLAKQFTAAAVLLLESRGRLSLEDSIGKYLDGVPADKTSITIRHLLAHTSGLDSDFPYENMIGEDYEEVARDEAVRRILATPLIGKVGAERSYSNIGYVLAAAVVEKASGRPFRDFLRSELFLPTGLRNTGFWGEGLPRVPDRQLARSYDETGETADLRRRSSATWFDLGGGEVVSTIEDLYTWVQVLREDRLLPASARQVMWKEPGLGWEVGAAPTRLRIHAGGDYIGFGADVAIYPEENVVIVHLANRRYDVLGTRHAADRVVPDIVFGEKLEMFAGETFDVPPEWTSKFPARLAAVAGEYRLASGGSLILTKTRDGCSISARGQDAVDVLAPSSEEERAARRRCNDRALALFKAAADGDTAAIAATIREGGPVKGWMDGLRGYLNPGDGAAPLDIEVIGTEPAAFPRQSRRTVIRIRYPGRELYLRFGWNPANRLMYRGEGGGPLASTPLRANRAGHLVGWNIVWARSLHLDVSWKAGKVQTITIVRDEGTRVSAQRAPSTPNPPSVAVRPYVAPGRSSHSRHVIVPRSPSGAVLWPARNPAPVFPSIGNFSVGFRTPRAAFQMAAASSRVICSGPA